MERRQRLARIGRILESGGIADQAALQKRLGREGFHVSQASLSRDLKYLGAQRVRGPAGDYYYALPQARPVAPPRGDLQHRLAESVSDVCRCQFMVLVLTPPGEASMAGEILDRLGLPELSGTVAGDDTLLCVAENLPKAKRLEKKLKEMIG